MAVVVEPTLPFSSESLHLDDHKRWSQLLPLIHPQYQAISTASGNVLINASLAASQSIIIAAVIPSSQLSSVLLAGNVVSVIAVSENGKDGAAGSIGEALKSAGVVPKEGMIVVQCASKDVSPRGISTVTDKIVRIDTAGGVQFDHILSLLASAKPEVRNSFTETNLLIEAFLKANISTTSTFGTAKTGSLPSRVHALGTSEIESAKHAVQQDLAGLLSNQSVGDAIYSIHYADINGLARLENYLLAHEIAEFLDTQKLQHYITTSSIHDHANPTRGFSISISALPSKFLAALPKPNPDTLTQTTKSTISSACTTSQTSTSKIQLPASLIKERILAGCNALIVNEPIITKYDEIVGDGDCGYTLRDGGKQVSAFINGQTSSQLENLPQMLTSLVDDLEVNMGGTSGALYCIFISALSQSLAVEQTFPGAVKGALDTLLRYTKARLGDRTCLDCLIPFVEKLANGGSVQDCLEEARKGVEGTKVLEAKLGRSTYLDEAATRGVPDPGAAGLLVLLEGLCGVN